MARLTGDEQFTRIVENPYISFGLAAFGGYGLARMGFPVLWMLVVFVTLTGVAGFIEGGTARRVTIWAAIIRKARQGDI